MADDPTQAAATAEAPEPTPQPATDAAPQAQESDLGAAMRSLVDTTRRSQVAASRTASNEGDEQPAAPPKPVEPPAPDAPAEPVAAESSTQGDDASTAEPEKKSRRALAQEERDAELKAMREQVQAEQAAVAKLQKEAQEREARDVTSRQVVAEAIGTDDEYNALLSRKARERDYGLLSAEDDDKLARWAATREILKPALDMARSEGRQAGHTTGQNELLGLMDAEIVKIAGELQVPLSDISGKGFGEIARAFHSHAASRLAASEQRTKELSDTVANLEAELSSLRAKSAGAGRMPQVGGQSSAAGNGKAPSWKSMTPLQKMEAGLSAGANG